MMSVRESVDSAYSLLTRSQPGARTNGMIRIMQVRMLTDRLEIKASSEAPQWARSITARASANKAGSIPQSGAIEKRSLLSTKVMIRNSARILG